MLLIPSILTINLLNLIFILFLTFAFFIAIKIILYWDINKNDPQQYTLLKQNYLASLIIKVVFFIKIPLFLFFVYTLDHLSLIIPGAMCAVGVINAVSFGTSLMIFKIFNLYIFGFWLILNKVDNQNINYPYTKTKYIIFAISYFIFLAEVILEFYFFQNLDPSKLTSCCSSVYSASSTTIIGKILSENALVFVVGFYINFILLLLFYKKNLVFAILNILFLIFSLTSLITFFSVYIYQLPTHHCPFCLLQKDYNYIGYFIYTFLFLGTFLGLSNILEPKYKKYSLIFNFLVVLIFSYYMIRYHEVTNLF